jgi:hypothetical protein
VCPIAIALVTLAALPPTESKLPPLNAAMVRFCEERVGQQVGRGGCSEIALAGLAAAGARTRGFDPAIDENGGPVWGTPVERLDDVLPGDIVEFHKVRILEVRPNGTRYERLYPEHTAVVARIRGGGAFDLFEQNVITAGATAKRRHKVRRHDVDFRGIVEGTIRVYRPEAK